MSLSDSNMQVTSERTIQVLDKNEPLLQENDKRFVVFPIKYHDIWSSYKDNLKNFWICGNVRLVDYVDDTSKGDLEFLKKILSFWATYSEQQFLFRLNNEIQIPEARCFLGYQIHNATNHMELFSRLIRDLAVDRVTDQKSPLVEELFAAQESFGARIVTYSAMQGVFSASLHPVKAALAKSPRAGPIIRCIDLVLRDRTDQARFGPVLMEHCVNKPTNEKIRSIVEIFVEIETKFLLDLLKQFSGVMDTALVTDLVRRQGNWVCELFQRHHRHQESNILI